MTFECERCGEQIDVEVSEFQELAQLGRYDLDCGTGCKQSNVQRFTLHFSVTELAVLVPKKKDSATETVAPLDGQRKIADALGELGNFDADIYTRAEGVLIDLRAQMSTAIIFRQSVTDTLAALRAELAGTLSIKPADEEERMYDAATRAAVCGIDATITELGLVPKEKQ